jgi:1-deoxy-D-xylulose-5-phosphate synthase
MVLEKIQKENDIKKLTHKELELLKDEIRQFLIESISVTGGHLASNLGVVELTMALHLCFDLPKDKIVWDVGHQSYTHKILTGRKDGFSSLRQYGGMSGFPKADESDCDCFNTGHSSTSISAGLGLATARQVTGDDYHVVSVIGDGALTGGMAYEALNNASNVKGNFIIVLNDNNMSISENVGGISQYLSGFRTADVYRDFKNNVMNSLNHIPIYGERMVKHIRNTKSSIKQLFIPGMFFEEMGIIYLGPVDGSDIKEMCRVFDEAKRVDGPVLVHVLTKKGYGYSAAEDKPERFHGTPPFYVETGTARKKGTLPSYGQVMAETLSEMAKTDEKIVAITAAMPSGTGLSYFAERFPRRMMDVGIAEEHAVTMAAGLAAGGMKPYFAVYASFFQRSFDQMIHDVCMPKLNVTLLLDRAGLVGEDGATHHGVWDLASMLPVPNMVILAPRDLNELRVMMRWTQENESPCAIRYGRESVDLSARYPAQDKPFRIGEWELMEQGGDVALLAVGSIEVRDLLEKRGIHASLVNCRSVKPMDEKMLRQLANRPIVTMEEHVLTGGFGSVVCAFLSGEGLPAPMLSFGIPDTFVQHGRRDQLLKYLGLTPELMTQRIVIALKNGEKHQ